MLPTALSLAWLGPVIGAVTGLVPPHMRATASAMFLFIVNLIGLGLGAMVIGLISDALTQQYGAEALRYSAMATTSLYLVAAGLMGLAALRLARAALDPTAAGGRGMVWTYVTLDDLRRHGQRPYVMDALIDPVRTVAEADVAVLVKQTGAGEWAVSLRSKGAVDVSLVAIEMGGGGHRLAAGFTGRGTPGDVVVAVRGLLERFLI